MNHNNKYTAIILAAGIGSRISDLTTDPKCLLLVNGKTLLEWNLEALIFCQIEKVVIVIGYKDSLVREVASRFFTRLEVHFVFNNNFQTMGNTFSLYCGLAFVKTPSLVFDADLIFDRDILLDFMKTGISNQVLVGDCDIADIECSKVLSDSSKLIRVFADKREVTAEELRHFELVGEAIGVLKFSGEYTLKLSRMCGNLLLKQEFQNTNWESLLNVFVTMHDLSVHSTISERWIEVDTKKDYETALDVLK